MPILDNLIIGAGPAGIQMAYFLRDQNYLVVDKGTKPCQFFHTFPRQRKLISINKNRDKRYDWNSFLTDDGDDTKVLRDYSEEFYPPVDSYLKYVEDFVEKHKINIRFNFCVTKMVKQDDVFIINEGEIIAKRVFFGIGLAHKTPPLDRGYTYENMPLDPNVYRGKHVYIIGSGNAALETADYIAPYTDVTEIWGRSVNAWKTHYPGHARSLNFTSIDSYYLKARTIFHFTNEKKFENSSTYQRALRRIEKNPDILVLWCHGFKFNTNLIEDLVIVDKFPILTPNFESTICPNLFFIGSATQYHDYKKGTSAFIHGFRYNCEYLHRYITNSVEVLYIPTCPELVSVVFNQLNTSSALFHRFDQFCDLVGVTENGFHYIREIPISSIEYFKDPKWEKFFTIKLGYNGELLDTFNQLIHIHPRDGEKCRFIHPIIQYNSYTFHLPEEQLNEYIYYDRHIYPFNLYLGFILNQLNLDEVKRDINSIGQLDLENKLEDDKSNN